MASLTRSARSGRLPRSRRVREIREGRLQAEALENALLQAQLRPKRRLVVHHDSAGHHGVDLVESQAEILPCDEGLLPIARRPASNARLRENVATPESSTARDWRRDARAALPLRSTVRPSDVGPAWVLCTSISPQSLTGGCTVPESARVDSLRFDSAPSRGRPGMSSATPVRMPRSSADHWRSRQRPLLRTGDGRAKGAHDHREKGVSSVGHHRTFRSSGIKRCLANQSGLKPNRPVAGQ